MSSSAEMSRFSFIGNISVNANPNLDGTVVAQYVLIVQVSDGELAENGTFTINITIVNDPPVLVNLPDTITIPENTMSMARVLTVTSTDPEADAVVYTLTSLQSPSPFVINSTSKFQRLYRSGFLK